MSDRPVVQISIVILAVDDLERSAAFYEGAFAWKRVVDAPVYIEYATGQSTRVALYQRDAFAVNTGGQPSRADRTSTTATELYLRVDDLDERIRRLRAVGARELDSLRQRDWGDDAAYFADPDGNVLAVSRPSE